MSQIVLLAADKPLPLCSYDHVFRVLEHSYYRRATDELGYPIKPYQYELDLQLDEASCRALLAYLTEHFSSGEEVELWSIWLDNGPGRRPPHFRGTLADFDMETLEQLLPPRKPGRCWLTITI